MTSAAASQASSRASSAGTAAGAAASETAGAAAVNQNRSDGGLSTGAIVGIAVGVGIFGLLLLLALLFCCLRRRKRRRQEAGASSASSFNEEPKVAPMAMATSDTSLMKDDYPPANSHAREPTLPNVGELPAGSGTGPPVIPAAAVAPARNPFMDADEQPAPISNAVPVHSGTEAAAVVASQGANRPWKPTAPTQRYYEPPKQSSSANSMAGFDFGIGNQNRLPENHRHSILRRPVGGNGY